MKKSRQLSSVKTKKDERKVMGRALDGVAVPAAEVLVKMPDDYATFFASIKECIARECIKAVLAANAAMVLMYWR